MFRFTIRDVLWLTALVAVTLGMSLAWGADSERHKQSEVSLRKAIHDIRAEFFSEIEKSGRTPLDAKRDWEARQRAAKDNP